MPAIDFNFSGYIRGASVTAVTVTETGETLDVSDKTADEVATKLASKEWSIALGDFLYGDVNDTNETSVEFDDFEPEGGFPPEGDGEEEVTVE